MSRGVINRVNSAPQVTDDSGRDVAISRPKDGLRLALPLPARHPS